MQSVNLMLAQKILEFGWLTEAELRGWLQHAGHSQVNLGQLLYQNGVLTDEQFQRLFYQPAATLADSQSRDSSSGEKELADRFIADYKIVHELGRGAAGVVFLVEKSNQNFAAKVLTKSSGRQFQRFKNEAETLQSLDHPNVVKVHAFGRWQDQAYMILDYVNGESLDTRIERDADIEEVEAARILLDIASGLQHAHSQGVLHRDIKPANILLSDSGTGYLTDFGLAKFTESQVESLTRTGEMLGTPLYMPPEQLESKTGGEVDERSDIYALGATFYEMLTGEPLYRASSLMEMVGLILAGKKRPLRSINPMITAYAEAVCLRCLESKPEDRYQSLEELIDDLILIESGDPPDLRTSKLPFLIAIAVGACVLFGMALAVVLLSPDSARTGLNHTVTVKVESNINADYQLIGHDEQPIAVKTPQELSLKPGDYRIKSLNPEIALVETTLKVEDSSSADTAVTIHSRRLKTGIKFVDTRAGFEFQLTSTKPMDGARAKKIERWSQFSPLKEELIKVPAGHYKLAFRFRTRYRRQCLTTVRAGMVTEVAPALNLNVAWRMNVGAVEHARIATSDTSAEGVTEIGFVNAKKSIIYGEVNGLSSFRSNPIPTSFFPVAGYFDQTGDGIENLYFHTKRDNELVTFLKTRGRFRKLKFGPLRAPPLNVDLDVDGLLDIACLTKSGEFKVGFGGITPSITLPDKTSERLVGGITLDVNRDGKNDIVIANQSSVFVVFSGNQTHIGKLPDRMESRGLFVGDFILSNPGNEVLWVGVDPQNSSALLVKIYDEALKKLADISHEHLSNRMRAFKRSGSGHCLGVLDLKEKILTVLDFSAKTSTAFKAKERWADWVPIHDKNGRSSVFAACDGNVLQYKGYKPDSTFMSLTYKDKIDWLEAVDANGNGEEDVVVHLMSGDLVVQSPIESTLNFEQSRPTKEPVFASFWHKQFLQLSSGHSVDTETGIIRPFSHSAESKTVIGQIRSFCRGASDDRFFWARDNKVYECLESPNGFVSNRILTLKSTKVLRLSFHGDSLFVSDFHKKLRCYKVRGSTVTKRWVQDLPGQLHVKPIPFTGPDNELRLCAITNSGELVISDASTGSPIKAYRFPGGMIFDPVKVNSGALSQRYFFASQLGFIGFLELSKSEPKISVTRRLSASPASKPLVLYSGTKVSRFVFSTRYRGLVLAANGLDEIDSFAQNGGIMATPPVAVDVNDDGADEFAVAYWGAFDDQQMIVLYDQQGRPVLRPLGMRYRPRLVPAPKEQRSSAWIVSLKKVERLQGRTNIQINPHIPIRRKETDAWCEMAMGAGVLAYRHAKAPEQLQTVSTLCLQALSLAAGGKPEALARLKEQESVAIKAGVSFARSVIPQFPASRIHFSKLLGVAELNEDPTLVAAKTRVLKQSERKAAKSVLELRFSNKEILVSAGTEIQQTAGKTRVKAAFPAQKKSTEGVLEIQRSGDLYISLTVLERGTFELFLEHGSPRQPVTYHANLAMALFKNLKSKPLRVLETGYVLATGDSLNKEKWSLGALDPGTYYLNIRNSSMGEEKYRLKSLYIQRAVDAAGTK